MGPIHWQSQHRRGSSPHQEIESIPDKRVTGRRPAALDIKTMPTPSATVTALLQNGKRPTAE